MPDFEITAPDGRRFIVTAPEGASEDEVLRYAQQSMPAAQEGSGVGAWLGRRARDVIEGVASFPSAAVDAMFPGLAYQRQAAGQPNVQQAARMGADALGLPTPQTDGERLTSAVVQGVAGALPTMGVGAPGVVGMLSQAVGGGAGGAAAEMARQGGYGEGVQTLAGLAGGLGGAGAVQGAAALGRGVASAAAPFTQRGREGAVADTMLRSSADPQNLAARVQAGIDAPDARLPNSPVTTALAARDPRLLGTEASIRDGALGLEPAIPLRDAALARARAQEAEITALGDSRTSGERGAAVRGQRAQGEVSGTGLSGAQQARQRVVSRAYEAIDPDNTSQLPTAPLRAIAQEELAGRWGAGSGEIPSSVRQLLGTVSESGDAQPWRFMQNLRGQANDILGDAAASERARATARRIVEAVDQSAQDAIATGGFTAEQAARWRTAGELRRRLGEDFNRDTTGANASGRILAEAGYGAPRIADEAVPGAALANVSSVRQVLRASGGDPQVRQALQGQFMDNLARQSIGRAQMVDTAGVAQSTTSPAGFRRFWDQNRVVARELFGPQEYRRLELLARDFAEASIGANTGRTRNSQTAQNLSVAGLIARSSNGLIDAGNPLAQTMFGIGPVMRAIYAAPEAATRELLGQAMADPRLAAMLLSRASPASVRRAANYIEQNMADRFLGAAGTAAFRQTVRTAGEEQRRQAQPSQ